MLTESTVLLVWTSQSPDWLVEQLDQADVFVESCPLSDFERTLTVVGPDLVLHVGREGAEQVVAALEKLPASGRVRVVFVAPRSEMEALRRLDRTIVVSVLPEEMAPTLLVERVVQLANRNAGAELALSPRPVVPRPAAQPRTLPHASPAPRVGGGVTGGVAPGDGPKRLLLVEDDITRADAVGAALRERGFAVHVAPLDTGSVRWALVSRFAPEVLIVDGGDRPPHGWLERLREDVELRSVRLVTVPYGQVFEESTGAPRLAPLLDRLARVKLPSSSGSLDDEDEDDDRPTLIVEENRPTLVADDAKRAQLEAAARSSVEPPPSPEADLVAALAAVNPELGQPELGKKVESLDAIASLAPDALESEAPREDSELPTMPLAVPALDLFLLEDSARRSFTNEVAPVVPHAAQNDAQGALEPAPPGARGSAESPANEESRNAETQNTDESLGLGLDDASSELASSDIASTPLVPPELMPSDRASSPDVAPSASFSDRTSSPDFVSVASPSDETSSPGVVSAALPSDRGATPYVEAGASLSDTASSPHVEPHVSPPDVEVPFRVSTTSVELESVGASTTEAGPALTPEPAPKSRALLWLGGALLAAGALAGGLWGLLESDTVVSVESALPQHADQGEASGAEAAEPVGAKAVEEGAAASAVSPASSPWRTPENPAVPRCERPLGDYAALPERNVEQASRSWEKARNALLLGDMERARDLMCRAVLMHSESLALEGLAELYLTLEAPEQAKVWVDAALELRPDRQKTRELLGDIENQLGRVDESRAVWVAAFSLGSKDQKTHDWLAKKLVIEAEEALRSGGIHRAVLLFRRAATLSAINADAPAGLARVAFRSERLEHAAGWAALALERVPGHADALVVQGDLALGRGDESAARQRYLQALEKNPSHRLALEQLARLDGVLPSKRGKKATEERR